MKPPRTDNCIISCLFSCPHLCKKTHLNVLSGFTMHPFDYSVARICVLANHTGLFKVSSCPVKTGCPPVSGMLGICLDHWNFSTSCLQPCFRQHWHQPLLNLLLASLFLCYFDLGYMGDSYPGRHCHLPLSVPVHAASRILLESCSCWYPAQETNRLLVV